MSEKNIIHRISATSAVALLLGATSLANAGIIEYSDRATWSAAIGGSTGGENFEGFGVDTSFDGSSVALGSGMTIGTQVADGSGAYNFIDVVPISTSESDVNGTAHARIFNGQSGSDTTPFISFGGGASAFGADFKNLNDQILRSRIELYDGVTLLATLTPPTVPSGTVGFWGFGTTAGETITEIRFTRVANDVYGIDDIEIRAASSVPEPAIIGLLGLGLTGLGLSRRRKQKA